MYMNLIDHNRWLFHELSFSFKLNLNWNHSKPLIFSLYPKSQWILCIKCCDKKDISSNEKSTVRPFRFAEPQPESSNQLPAIIIITLLKICDFHLKTSPDCSLFLYRQSCSSSLSYSADIQPSHKVYICIPLSAESFGLPALWTHSACPFLSFSHLSPNLHSFYPARSLSPLQTY